MSLPQSITATASARGSREKLGEGAGHMRAHAAAPCQLELDLAPAVYIHLRRIDVDGIKIFCQSARLNDVLRNFRMR